MTKIEGYTLSLPEQWRSWRPGEALALADEIAAALADPPGAQARVRTQLLAFDETPRDGMIVENGLWVPERTSGDVVGLLRVELLVAPPGQHVTAEEFLRSVRRAPRERGLKVFHYDAVAGDSPAGPAVLVTHTVGSRRGGPVVVTAEWTFFPPGADESLQLSFTTAYPAFAEALGDQSALVVGGLDVVVAQG